MTDQKDLDSVNEQTSADQTDVDNAKNSSDSADINSNNAIDRRQVIRTIVAGGGAVTAAAASDKWATPAVNSLILPAHAQTSGTTTTATTTTLAPVMFDPVGNFTSGGSLTFNSVFGPESDEFAADESISEELLEFFIPAAQAQSGSVVCGFNCSVEINATISTTNADFCFSGDINGFESGTVTTPSSGAPTLGDVNGVGGSSGFIDIMSGQFNEATGNWELMVLDGTNASPVVELTPGGPGCV